MKPLKSKFFDLIFGAKDPNSRNKWSEEAVRQLDNTFQRSYELLSGKLTFKDNFACNIKTITWKNGLEPIVISCPFVRAPLAINVLKVVPWAQDTFIKRIHTGNRIVWNYTQNGEIEIWGIDDLNLNTRYEVTLLLLEDS